MMVFVFAFVFSNPSNNFSSLHGKCHINLRVLRVISNSLSLKKTPLLPNTYSGNRTLQGQELPTPENQSGSGFTNNARTENTDPEENDSSLAYDVGTQAANKRLTPHASHHFTFRGAQHPLASTVGPPRPWQMDSTQKEASFESLGREDQTILCCFHVK